MADNPREGRLGLPQAVLLNLKMIDSNVIGNRETDEKRRLRKKSLQSYKKPARLATGRRYFSD